MKILIILILLSTQVAFAGHGRDGGWPKSVQLLRLAKQHLLELLNNSSDLDIKDAINGMADRQEAIKVKDVDLAMVKFLVSRLENPDVEEIENSTYTGVKLFDYDDTDPRNIRIFATKNFFKSERYQVLPSELNPALLKEVQKLILHEISHLWGFGEENGFNFAETFAVRMINILHGSFKVNFTQKEKLESLSKVFLFESRDISARNGESTVNGKTFECKVISAEGDKTERMQLNFSHYAHTIDGYELKTNPNSLLRWTDDGYLLIETSQLSSDKNVVLSKYFAKQSLEKSVLSLTVCSLQEVSFEKFQERFVRPYYSRSNLLTKLGYASLSVFRSLVIQDVIYFTDILNDVLEINIANQNQIIQNIDFKIKVQNAETYQRLIKRRGTKNKPQDDTDLELLNGLFNADVSTEVLRLWPKLDSKVIEMKRDVDGLTQMPARQLQLQHFSGRFLYEMGNFVEQIRSSMPDTSLAMCNFSSRIGKFFECQIELNKILAQDRISTFKRLQAELKTRTSRNISDVEEIED